MKIPFAKQFKTRRAIITGFVLFTGLVVCYFALPNQPDTDSVKESSGSAAVVEKPSDAGRQDTAFPGKANEIHSFENWLVKQLKEKYGGTISEASTQVLLLKIKRNILKQYPENGISLFRTIIRRAFPELAETIFKTIASMEQYLLWEMENRELLSQMNILEKQGILWGKRHELFGDDAEDIWSEEVVAHERRKQEVHDTIRSLNDSYETSISDKLDIYREALTNAYDDTPEAFVLEHKDLLSKVFFGLESVQAELGDMEPEERKLEINRIRSEMGFSQQQVEELEKMDDYRNRRWDNGLAYMAERDMVAQSYKGAELDAKLKELREKYFKHEAKTIELEENDGFYRYERTRIYGRN